MCACMSVLRHTLYHSQVDLVSGWHDNLKSKKESAVAPQGDKAKGGKGKGRQVVLDSGSDTDA